VSVQLVEHKVMASALWFRISILELRVASAMRIAAAAAAVKAVVGVVRVV